MKELTIRKLIAKLKVSQLWGVFTALLVSFSSLFLFGYNIGTFYQETKVCYVELIEKDNAITSLNSEKMELKGKILELTSEVSQCKIIVLTLEKENSNMEPILRVFLEELKTKYTVVE